jgi:hypothetical protein
MVLANRRVCLFFAGCVYSSFSWASSSDIQSTEKLLINNRQIELRVEDNECIAVDIKTNERVNVSLSTPCRFVRKKDGAVMKYHYPGKGYVVAVAGKPASQDYIARWPNISLSDNCADEARGLIFKGESFAVTRDKAQGGLYCPLIGLDEKVYYRFAHPK